MRHLCAHCALPIAPGLIDPSEGDQFCCAGCRTVYAVIHSCQLDRYYDYLERDRDAGGEKVPAKITRKAYGEFDDPVFLNVHAPLRQDRTRSVEFYLEGVHCTACVWLVEKVSTVMPAVIEARLDFGKRLVRVTWRADATSLSAIARLLDSLGYPPHPARSGNARQIRQDDDRRRIIRVGVAGACAGNAMLLATALYAGAFSGMDPTCVALFRWLSMIIGIVALAWPGSVFFRGAWAALRMRSPHLDLPIALALGVGGIAGSFNTLFNTGDAYFDSLSVLVFLLLLGRLLQSRRQSVAEDAVERLFSLTPISARRVTGGAVEEVAITALGIGDVVEVLPGQAIPVDGRLLEGFRTTVDESLLTGESRALPKGHFEGTSDLLVHAGATNISSPIRVAVLATGESTRVGKIMRLVAECARRKAPLVLFADRIAGWFLGAVLIVAAGVFITWWLIGERSAAINQGIAVLIVACPCALGLATPLAVTIAIGRAARRGILIKGGDTLERLARPGLLFLDKTGTLTTGIPAVQFWEGDCTTRLAVAAIESHATHPVARALACVSGESIVGASLLPRASGIMQDVRGGISGLVGGRRYWIGTVQYAWDADRGIPANWRANIEAVLSRGLSPVIVSRESGGTREICGLAGAGDSLRSDAISTVATLRAQGWKLAILSGDHPDVVARVARTLDIPDARGGLFPEQKLAIVQAAVAEHARQRGPVVMVGDGVNDSAALAAASVGIAVHGGVEASLSAASIYLSTPGLSGLNDVMHAARSTVRVIRRCLYASIVYNIFTISLAAIGWINPLAAAVLMPISSLTVISLAFAARTFPSTGDQR